MSPTRCYLLVGSDRARKRRRIAQLAHAHQVALLDRHHVHAAELSAAALAALARAHPAASPLRLLVIDEAQRLDASCVSLLRNRLDLLTQVSCLALLVDGDLAPQHPLAALARAAAVERFEASSDAPQVERFALVEAIARGDAAGALRAMQEQVALGKEPTELIGLLVWQLSRWVTVKRCLEAGMPQEPMLTLTGLAPWQLQRAVDEVATRSMRQLRQWLERCWEIDVAIKTGKAIPRVALEALVVGLCVA